MPVAPRSPVPLADTDSARPLSTRSLHFYGLIRQRGRQLKPRAARQHSREDGCPARQLGVGVQIEASRRGALLQCSFELRLAPQALTGDCGKRCEVGQTQIEGRAWRSCRDGADLQGEQAMIRRQLQRARGIVQLHRGVDAQWRIREQSRLRSGNDQAFGRCLHCESSAVGVQVCVERRERGAPGDLQRIDLKSPCCTRRTDGAVPVPLQGDTLPGQSGTRSHGGSLEAVGQIRRLSREIDAALGLSTQVARSRRELHALRGARARQVHHDRQLAQTRVLQQARERPPRRLGELEGGIHARRIEAQPKLVVTCAIGAARHDGGARVLQRDQMCAALNGERSRLSGELRAQCQCADPQLLDVDARQPGARAALVRLAHGPALDVESRQTQTADVHVPCQKRNWRPAQRDTLGSEPHAARVAEPQLLEVNGPREGAGEAREAHMSVRQTEGRLLNQRAPARGVASDEDRCGEHHDEQQHRADGPGGDLQGAPHQKACPRPM